MTDLGIVLDLDGTLVDSTYHHALAWRRAFDDHDVAVALWRVHRAVGMGGDRLVGEVAGDDVEEEYGDRLRDSWREQYDALRSEVRPLADASRFVAGLTDAGHRVALASSGDPEFTDDAVEQLGIRDHLDVLLTAEDADSSKPDPDLVQVALERLGTDRAVLLGDSTYDAVAARAAGIGCVGVRTGGFGEAELTEAGASLVVGSVSELLDLDWSVHAR